MGYDPWISNDQADALVGVNDDGVLEMSEEGCPAYFRMEWEMCRPRKAECCDDDSDSEDEDFLSRCPSCGYDG